MRIRHLPALNPMEGTTPWRQKAFNLFLLSLPWSIWLLYLYWWGSMMWLKGKKNNSPKRRGSDLTWPIFMPHRRDFENLFLKNGSCIISARVPTDLTGQAHNTGTPPLLSTCSWYGKQHWSQRGLVHVLLTIIIKGTLFLHSSDAYTLYVHSWMKTGTNSSDFLLSPS